MFGRKKKEPETMALYVVDADGERVMERCTGPYTIGLRFPKTQRVRISDVIYEMANQLGVELTYQEETPAKIRVDPVTADQPEQEQE